MARMEDVACRSGVGEAGDLHSAIGGEPIHQIPSCGVRTCPTRVDPDSGMSQSWKWCLLSNQSVPWLSRLDAWTSAALHMRRLQIPPELP